MSILVFLFDFEMFGCTPKLRGNYVKIGNKIIMILGLIG